MLLFVSLQVSSKDFHFLTRLVHSPKFRDSREFGDVKKIISGNNKQEFIHMKDAMEEKNSKMDVFNEILCKMISENNIIIQYDQGFGAKLESGALSFSSFIFYNRRWWGH